MSSARLQRAVAASRESAATDVRAGSIWVATSRARSYESLMLRVISAAVGASLCLGWMHSVQEEPPDLILHHGKLVTVDDRFSIR